MTWHLANYMRMCHPNHRIVIFASTMRKYCSICSLLEVLVLTPIYGIVLYCNAIIFYYTSIYDLLWVCNCIPSLACSPKEKRKKIMRSLFSCAFRSLFQFVLKAQFRFMKAYLCHSCRRLSFNLANEDMKDRGQNCTYKSYFTLSIKWNRQLIFYYIIFLELFRLCSLVWMCSVMDAIPFGESCLLLSPYILFH